MCHPRVISTATVSSGSPTGAHGFSMGYQYNAKLRSSEILLEEDGNVRMIRRAERPEDYFATLYGFDFEK